jgi:hypothetical protein
MLSSSSYGNFASFPSSYVTDYGDRVVFSQKFTGDISSSSSGLPFMTPRSDEEIASSFYQFVSNKSLRLRGEKV